MVLLSKLLQRHATCVTLKRLHHAMLAEVECEGKLDFKSAKLYMLPLYDKSCLLFNDGWMTMNIT